jgi:FkbH-like protein
MNQQMHLVTDFTAETLAALLMRRGFDASLSPFDAVEPALRTAEQTDWRFVWTRPERVSPSFGRLLAFEAVDPELIDAEVRSFAGLLATAAARARGTLVARWTIPSFRRGLGVRELDPIRGASGALLRMNLMLAEQLSAIPGLHLLDAERWMSLSGAPAAATKLWFLNKTPFDLKVLRAAADDVAAAVRGMTGQARKLVVLDLDDTLWDGIVGEDGWENLRLGGHDPIGEALVAFQERLKALTHRGILLAVVSRNDESVALEAIRCHPEMILRVEDFAGWRINWRDKAANIASLTEELGLGLQSVVFIDDQAHERARVAEALPEVLVPEWPADKLLYGRALDELDCFDTAALTDEDRSRSAMYVAERQRRHLQGEVPSHEAWLASLGTNVLVEPFGPANATRVAQLLNKTNQLNLTTRRLTENEIAAWMAAPGTRLLAFRVADRFGDAGLCGVLGLEVAGDTLRITDFLLSCRVMGRRVEEAMLAVSVGAAREAGCRQVEATWIPTKKNRPCREFFEKSSGFTAEGDDFRWDASQPYPVPAAVALRSNE